MYMFELSLCNLKVNWANKTAFESFYALYVLTNNKTEKGV